MPKVHIDRLRVRLPSGVTDPQLIARHVERALSQKLPPHAAVGSAATQLGARVTGALQTRRGR